MKCELDKKNTSEIDGNLLKISKIDKNLKYMRENSEIKHMLGG